MVRFAAALLAAGVAVGLVTADEAPAKLKLGDQAPTFADLPNAGTVGPKRMSLKDFRQDALVVVITCNHCPFAQDYEGRVKAFAAKYATGDKARVGVVAINVNNGPEDRYDKMVEHARERKFNFPYLYDKSQAVARKLYATVTPEFYVFDRDRRLVYWGGFDDNIEPGDVTENYVTAAVEATLQGKTPAVQRVRASGCAVEYGQ